MNLFNVGDIVIINPNNLETGMHIPFNFTPEMEEYNGKKAKIVSIRHNRYTKNKYNEIDSKLLDECEYLLDIDREMYKWASVLLKNFNNTNDKLLGF